MAIKNELLLLVLVVSMLKLGLANKNFTGPPEFSGPEFNNTNGWFQGHFNATRGPRKIIVGGSNKWGFGFNYTDWALKNGPFYIGDSLVFKFDPPTSDPNSHPHSVYLLKTYRSFMNCNLKKAKKIAGSLDGAGKGFTFRLKTWRPHYFACGGEKWTTLQYRFDEIPRISTHFTMVLVEFR